MDGQFFKSMRRLKNMFKIVVFIVVMQSVFTDGHQIIVQVYGIKMLTLEGLLLGLNFLFRLLVIISSGSILANTDTRLLVEALMHFKLPFEIAFMVLMGIRFIPLYVEEFRDTTTAIQLRGVNIKKTKVKDKLEIYMSILLPVLVNTLESARTMSLAIESKGFGLTTKRTSVIELVKSKRDYMLEWVSIIFAVLIFVHYFQIT